MRRPVLAALPLTVFLLTTTNRPARADGVYGEPAPSSSTPDTSEPGPSPTDSSPLAKDGHPLAGWHNGLFYLRDYNDNYVLYPQGRAQIDTYAYAGPGIPETTLKPTMFLRRVRPEVTGEFFHRWWFMIAGDFGVTSLDNNLKENGGPGTETLVAPPGTSAGTATTAQARYASPQTASIKAAPTDVYINYKVAEIFNIQAGQYDLPFTMENRTSDKYFEFIERPLAVRAIGVPENKDIGAMAWGWTGSHTFFYSAGVYNGAGQNRLNTDGRPEGAGRVFVRPLAASARPPLKDLQIGASIKLGSHDNHFTDYDYPSMSTQTGFSFWSPTYSGANGFTHVIPSGTQLATAGELRIPFGLLDLQGEFVYIDNQTREALDGYQATNSERFGEIKGYSYYAQVGFWPFGNRDINGLPGDEGMQHLNWNRPDPVKPGQALQLLLKWEQVALTYNSASRSGAPDPKNEDGNIDVNAFSIGANYWASKHIRVSANYIYDMFPNSEPTSATEKGGPTWSATNRAQAPGNTLGVGLDNSARDTAHSMHEFVMRFAIAL
jgi:phosphate-selective porin